MLNDRVAERERGREKKKVVRKCCCKKVARQFKKSHLRKKRIALKQRAHDAMYMTYETNSYRGGETMGGRLNAMAMKNATQTLDEKKRAKNQSHKNITPLLLQFTLVASSNFFNKAASERRASNYAKRCKEWRKCVSISNSILIEKFPFGLFMILISWIFFYNTTPCLLEETKSLDEEISSIKNFTGFLFTGFRRIRQIPIYRAEF